VSSEGGNLAVAAPGSAPSARSASFPILLACFFFSGATALVYEVVWLRMLGLVFGHTVYAITTVLVAFMGGLGLGSVLIGRRSARFGNPIRVYGTLEIGVGLLCAATPGLMWLASLVYPSLHRLLVSSYGAFSLVQFVLALAILLPPTILMGGTLPVLSQALVRRPDGIGRTVGALYAANTFGAVGGVVLAGYGLLPAFGNRATLWLAVTANLAVGAIAIGWSRRHGGKPDASLDRLTPPEAPAALPWRADPGAWLVAAALGVSGAVSMVYEVAWTRALVLLLGSSTFAFTAMLVALLLGIAWGSAVYSALWGRRPGSPAIFAAIQVGIGAATLLVVLVFERLPELLLLAIAWSDSPSFVELVQVLISAHVLLPSALLIGATFPCAVAAVARNPVRAGADVGWLYAVNTAGAIVGAALAGFVLVPMVGVQGAIGIGIGANVVTAGALALARDPRTTRRWATVAAAALVAGGVLLAPRWNPSVMTSGPAVYAKSYLQESVSVPDDLRGFEVLFYRDGPSASVAVTRSDQYLSLRVNGKAEASTEATDMPNQLLSGHLPLLLHPQPRDVLLIGLGSGITAGAIAQHPIERLDVVEIEPAVIEAARFFAHEHAGLFKDSRVHMVLADGRNFLMTTPRRYDVIVSEPSNPWIGGVASLFTREYFQLARQRLRPDGIMVQWLQVYKLQPVDVQMIVRTFQTVFPAASIWHAAGGDLLLLGRVEPRRIDLDLIRDRYDSSPGAQRDLRQIGDIGWSAILGHFLLGEADAARCIGPGPVNTDDRLSLEFSAPRALYLDTVTANGAWLTGCRVAELPEVTAETRGQLDRPEIRHWIGTGMLTRGAQRDALRYLMPGTAVLSPGPPR
jgi:spermidine synthase